MTGTEPGTAITVFAPASPLANEQWLPQVYDIKGYGGAGGIRTLDRAFQPYNGLANRPAKLWKSHEMPMDACGTGTFQPRNARNRRKQKRNAPALNPAHLGREESNRAKPITALSRFVLCCSERPTARRKNRHMPAVIIEPPDRGVNTR